ncbi:MAG: winged helix-turn-helix domain-containing protein [Bacillota bacterium]
MQAEILLVEDDPAVAMGVIHTLAREGWRTHHVATVADARRALARTRIDLAILDIGLPDGSGLELCREIRQETAMPVLFLSARDDELDKVLGLELGGDDYLTKPFSVRELASRVRALLRRAYGGNGPAAQQRVLKRHDLTLDLERRRAWRGANEIALTPIEFSLLWTMAQRPGMVFTREMLLDQVWPAQQWAGDEQVVNVHIRRLREKLEPDPAEPRYIVTVRGAGYRFAEEGEA